MTRAPPPAEAVEAARQIVDAADRIVANQLPDGPVVTDDQHDQLQRWCQARRDLKTAADWIPAIVEISRALLTAAADLAALRAEREAMPKALYLSLVHGDEEHRAWLQEALRAFFAKPSQPGPPVRGQATSDALRNEVAALRAELMKYRNGTSLVHCVLCHDDNGECVHIFSTCEGAETFMRSDHGRHHVYYDYVIDCPERMEKRTT